MLREIAEAVTTRDAYAEEVKNMFMYSAYSSIRANSLIYSKKKQYLFDRRLSQQFSLQARKAGAVPKLTSLLKHLDIAEDEIAMNSISSIIAACSGPMASGVRIRSLYYQGLPVTVKEGALGDGVGAKVWTVAHTLCQEMAENHQIVAGQSVLEIGAGCGPCGLLAAKIGASEVVISDYVDQLLLNLRDALHMNGFSGSENEHQQAEGGRSEKNQEVENGAVFDENWDPEEDEDVSECSDLDAFFRGDCEEEEKEKEDKKLVGNDSPRGAGTMSWEAGLTSIRFLDWGDSVEYLKREKENRGVEEVAAESKHEKAATPAAGGGGGVEAKATERTSNHAALDGISSRSIAPEIPNSKQFDVVLGTDILYEWEMAESVAAAVAHRVRPGGRVLICNAVRDQAMFDSLIKNMRKQGLRVGVSHIQPRQEDGGVAPHDHPYEGGFVLVAAEHEDAPATDWHRDDLFL